MELYEWSDQTAQVDLMLRHVKTCQDMPRHIICFMDSLRLLEFLKLLGLFRSSGESETASKIFFKPLWKPHDISQRTSIFGYCWHKTCSFTSSAVVSKCLCSRSWTSWKLAMAAHSRFKSIPESLSSASRQNQQICWWNGEAAQRLYSTLFYTFWIGIRHSFLVKLFHVKD